MTENHCLRCGRILKQPKSISLGYGICCYNKKFGVMRKVIKYKKPKYDKDTKSLDEYLGVEDKNE
jgi:hypothetical protein